MLQECNDCGFHAWTLTEGGLCPYCARAKPFPPPLPLSVETACQGCRTVTEPLNDKGLCKGCNWIAVKVGRKSDESKDRWDLVPYAALQQVVKALEHGAQKYGDDNWRFVEEGRRRYFAAAMRHMTAWWGGEKLDKETGYSHLAHAACCLLFLIARSDMSSERVT